MNKSIVSVHSLVVSAKVNRAEIKEGIDTGVHDGSGSLIVTADRAVCSKGQTTFYNVNIEAVNPTKGNGYGYADWCVESLKAEAESMLERDYCH